MFRHCTALAAAPICGQYNAREQEQAIALGGKDVVYITPEEAETREKEAHQSLARSWELWKREVMAK